jgi:hypothetical protein
VDPLAPTETNGGSMTQKQLALPLGLAGLGALSTLAASLGMPTSALLVVWLGLWCGATVWLQVVATRCVDRWTEDKGGYGVGG